MYVPAHSRVEDRARLLAFMRDHPFVTLITAPGGEPFASHVPVVVHDDADGAVVLRSHLARANPQWRHFAASEPLVVFHGPHALVHANWYPSGPSVPTWNYAVVHASGPARVLDHAEDVEVARSLVRTFTPDLRPLPPEHEARLLAGLVTFEVRVTRLEGKFKLSGNRPPEDREAVIRALADSERPLDRDTANLMRESS